MTTTPASITGIIALPTNVRIAHIQVTPPSAYAAGGFVIPTPTGFRSIKAAIVNQRYSATLAAVWYFDVATQKLWAAVAGTAGAANPLIETSAVTIVTPIDLVVFDWDEDTPTRIAAA